MRGWTDMHHDLDSLGEMSLREKMTTWVEWYWWPTRRWVPKVAMWWAYNVKRYPKPPPLAKDRIAQHFGWAGNPQCVDGPVCSAHGWDVVRDPAGGSKSHD